LTAIRFSLISVYCGAKTAAAMQHSSIRIGWHKHRDIIAKSRDGAVPSPLPTDRRHSWLIRKRFSLSTTQR
jgi:hypothetical protein